MKKRQTAQGMIVGATLTVTPLVWVDIEEEKRKSRSSRRRSALRGRSD